MADKMDGNKLGKYDLIHNEAGMAASGGRLYYQTYIPADLSQAPEEKLYSADVLDGVKAIYQEIGKQQGFCFFEKEFRQKDLSRRNDLFYRQEIAALLGISDGKVELTDIFSDQPISGIRKRLPLYEYLVQDGGAGGPKILSGRVQVGKRRYPFRNTQIWEEEKVKRISLREHNPPAPERIAELMKELEGYRAKEDHKETMVTAGLLCYQFLTIMPYQEDNEIWASLLLNCFLREKGVDLEYYIPFGRYFFQQPKERKEVMKQVRESGDYSHWIRFYLELADKAFEHTNSTVMRLEQLRRDALSSILKEKQKELLKNIILYMEENPMFIISDIEKKFDIAYNTAAKMVSILEKHGLVKEISKKQRYRIYCYEKYVEEILK